MNRRGMALLIALVALLLLTAIATAALAAARLRWLSGSRQLAARLAFEAAAGSAARHASEWDTAAALALAPAGVRELSGHGGAAVVTRDTLFRLGATLYLIKSVALVKALDGSVLARDGVAQLVQIVQRRTTDTAALRDALVRAYGNDDVAMVTAVSLLPWGWWRWP